MDQNTIVLLIILATITYAIYGIIKSILSKVSSDCDQGTCTSCSAKSELKHHIKQFKK